MQELLFLTSVHTCKQDHFWPPSDVAEATVKKVDNQNSGSVCKHTLVWNIVSYLRTIPDLNNCVICPRHSSLIPFNTSSLAWHSKMTSRHFRGSNSRGILTCLVWVFFYGGYIFAVTYSECSCNIIWLNKLCSWHADRSALLCYSPQNQTWSNSACSGATVGMLKLLPTESIELHLRGNVLRDMHYM